MLDVAIFGASTDGVDLGGKSCMQRLRMIPIRKSTRLSFESIPLVIGGKTEGKSKDPRNILEASGKIKRITLEAVATVQNIRELVFDELKRRFFPLVD